MRNRDDYEGRIIEYILSGNTDMIKTLFDIGFLRPDDTFNFTGGNSNNPEDRCSALALIAKQYTTIPNYQQMIDLFTAKEL